MMRIVGMAIFNPQLLMFSSCLGGVLNFGLKMLDNNMNGVSIAIVSFLYVGFHKFILVMTYYKHMKKLAFKVTSEGW